MDRVFSTLYYCVLGTVFAAALMPLSAAAQDARTYSRLVRADREGGAVHVRAGSDASFERFAAIARRAIGSGSDITPEEIISTNPGRIIYVCRMDDGTRRFSRDPTTHDICSPESRSFWLVRGLVYRVPIAGEHGAAASEEAQLRERVRVLEERLRERERSVVERPGAESEGFVTALDGVAFSVPVQPNQDREAEGPPLGYLLIGFMLGISLMCFWIIFVRRRIVRQWSEHRALLLSKYLSKLAKLERKLQDADASKELLREELSEAREALKRKDEELVRANEELSHALDTTGVRKRRDDGTGLFGTGDPSDDHASRTRSEEDAPTEELSAMSMDVEAHPLVVMLKEKLLSAEAELEERRGWTKRIPELMNRMEALKPNEYDLLCMRLRKLRHMRAEAERQSAANPEEGRLRDLMIELSYSRLIDETEREIAAFDDSPEGRQYREIREELTEIFMKATGLYGAAATMEASLERDRREIDRLHAEVKGESIAVRILQERLREEIQKHSVVAVPFKPIEAEETKRIKLPTKVELETEPPPPSEAEADVKLWEGAAKVAELEGRLKGVEQRLRETEDRHEQRERARDEQVEGLRAQMGELRMRLAEQEARNAELVAQNEALAGSSWTDKRIAAMPDPKSMRREKTKLWAGTGGKYPSTVPPPNISREEIRHLEDDLLKLMDRLYASVGGGVYLPFERHTVVDLAHLLAGAYVENPLLAGDFIPLRILPQYLSIQCDGKLPDRLRSPTMPPPGGMH